MIGLKRKVCGGFALALGLALLIPSTATAQVPELPPEVADLIGQLPDPLIPALPLGGGVSAGGGSASGAVVDVDGVVTVGKSETNSKTGTSKVTILSVGGQELLAKEGDATGGTNTGQLAALGDAVDSVNDALCDGGPPGPTAAPKTCIVLLYSEANETSTPLAENAVTKTTLEAESAQFRAISIHTAQAPESLTVGSSSATSISGKTFVKPTGNTIYTGCADIATAFLVSGTGTFATAFLLNPGGPAAGVAFSQVAPTAIC